VAFLVASPMDHPRVYICDECIDVCHSVLEERRGEAICKGGISPRTKSELLSPT
jgi:ATP-dependent protease Clp ATPase subunit